MSLSNYRADSSDGKSAAGRRVERRGKALIVTYGGGHASLMAPVAQELIRRDRIELTVVGLTIAAPVYRRFAVPTNGFAEYVRPGLDDDAVELGRTMLSDVGGVDERESAAYLGLSMRDLIGEFGLEEAWSRYRTYGRHAFLPRETVRRIISGEAPTVVVATNSPRAERAAIVEANLLSIDTLMVPDLFESAEWVAYGPYEAKYYAVMCDLTANNLVRDHGVSRSRIIVTGQPAFDKQFVPSVADCRTHVRDLLGHDPSPFCLVATGFDYPDQRTFQKGLPKPTSEYSRSVLSRLIELLPSLPDLRFVVKPHPSESEDQYRSILRNCPRFEVAPSGSNINMLLRASLAMVATCHTTTILDAASLGVPVMIISDNTNLRSLFGELEAIPTIRGDSDIADALKALIAEGPGIGRQRNARTRLAAWNRGAIERVAAVIEAIAAGDPGALGVRSSGLGGRTRTAWSLDGR